MSKTILVSDRTYEVLKKLKKKYKARSFDEVISRLILKEMGLPYDMFGIDRGRIKPFTAGDRMEDRVW